MYFNTDLVGTLSTTALQPTKKALQPSTTALQPSRKQRFRPVFTGVPVIYDPDDDVDVDRRRSGEERRAVVDRFRRRTDQCCPGYAGALLLRTGLRPALRTCRGSRWRSVFTFGCTCPHEPDARSHVAFSMNQPSAAAWNSPQKTNDHWVRLRLPALSRRSLADPPQRAWHSTLGKRARGE